MYQESITIDIDRLREDMKAECLGAYFGGGFGGALMEAIDIESAEPEELVEIAMSQGIDLRDYKV